MAPTPTEKPTGVVGAMLALSDLRQALATIQVPDPHYWHETPPTAADHLHDLLEIMDWHLHQISAYLNEPRA